MSVLFKALAKAAKTREAVAGTAAPVGQPAILSRGRGAGSKKRMFVLLGALLIGAAGGSYLFLLTDDDKPTPVRPAAVRPRPPLIQTPQAQQPAAVAPPAIAPSSPAAASASAPAVAPQLGVEQPQVTSAPVQNSPPAPIVSDPPVAKSAAPIMPVEEDLHTVLARLRRQKTEGTPVAVSRMGGRRDLMDEDGHAAIQVGVTPQANFDLAHAAYEDLMQGRYEQALGNYDKALKAEPRNTVLLLGKATALQKLGRTEEARKAYSIVLAADPANREALTNVTTLLAAQAPEKALADLETLRKANPDFSPIDAAIGAQQAALGDAAAAIDALNRAAMLSPENGLYRLNLAVLQDRAGQSGEAASSYRAALGLLSGSAAGLPLPVEQIRRRLAFLEGR